MPTLASTAAELAPCTGHAVMPNNWWFFDRLDRDFWNASFLLEVTGGYDEETLRQGVGALLDRHAVLRSRWITRDGHWRQEFRPREALPAWWSRVDLAGAGYADAAATVTRTCEQAQQGLSIGERVFEAVFFDLGPLRPARLFLNIHHLLMDAYSQGLVLRDLDRLCRDGGASAPSASDTSGAGSMAALADHWQALADSGAVATDLDYWRSLAWQHLRPLSTPPSEAGRLEHVPGVTATGLVSARKSADFTRRLLASQPGQGGVETLLVAAIALSVRDWTGAPALLLNLTCHNRRAPPAGFDLRNTVGWIGDYVDFLVDIGLSDDPLDVLQRVALQRRALAARETRYTLLRHVRPSAEAKQFFAGVPRHQLELNYIPPQLDPLGLRDGDASPGLRPAVEGVGPRQGRTRAGPAPFAKVYVDQTGELVLYWAYPLETFSSRTFDDFLNANLRHLEALVDALAPERSMAVDA